MHPERTPQSPDTSVPPVDPPPDPNLDSLLFYTTYGHTKLDPEVRLLSALMGCTEGSNDKAIALVTDSLLAQDFANTAHGELFTLITIRWKDGELIDPASINAALLEMSSKARQLRELLVSLVSVDAPTWRLSDIAKQVLIAWYHRQFQRAATTIQQIADEAPAHEKFALLREVGRDQAKADQRVRDFSQRIASLPTPSPQQRFATVTRPTLHSSQAEKDF